MWEADAVEWAYRIEEAQAWRERLELTEEWTAERLLTGIEALIAEL
jgi:hypothetical protein